MKESRKDFISRILWAANEVNKSDKGNILDIVELIDFNLSQREKELAANIRDRVSNTITEMINGNHSLRYTKDKVDERVLTYISKL